MDMKIEKTAKLAGIMTAVTLGLNYVFQLVGFPTRELFAFSPIATVGPGLGGSLTSLSYVEKIIGIVSGAIPVADFLATAIVLTYIASFAVLFAGGLLVNTFKLPSVKGKIGSLASVTLYGWLAFYLIIVGTAGLWSMSTLIGLALFTVPLAYITAWVSDIFRIG